MQPEWNPKKRSNPCAFGAVSAVDPRCHLPNNPVEYPAGLSRLAMVFSEDASGGPLVATPQRSGCRPVSSAAREGAHTGAAAYQLVKRTPPVARASICGV